MLVFIRFLVTWFLDDGLLKNFTGSFSTLSFHFLLWGNGSAIVSTVSLFIYIIEVLLPFLVGDRVIVIFGLSVFSSTLSLLSCSWTRLLISLLSARTFYSSLLLKYCINEDDWGVLLLRLLKSTDYVTPDGTLTLCLRRNLLISCDILTLLIFIHIRLTL